MNSLNPGLEARRLCIFHKSLAATLSPCVTEHTDTRGLCVQGPPLFSPLTGLGGRALGAPPAAAASRWVSSSTLSAAAAATAAAPPLYRR